MDFFESVTNFFSFFTSDAEFSFWHQIQARVVIWFLTIKAAAIENAWLVAKAVLIELDISSSIDGLYAQLDSDVRYWLSVFQVPEVISVMC